MPLTLAIMADAVPLKDRQVALSRMLVFGISGQIAGRREASVATYFTRASSRRPWAPWTRPKPDFL